MNIPNALRIFLIATVASLMVGFMLYGWALWPLSSSLAPDLALDRLLGRTQVLGVFKYVALLATVVTLWRVPEVRTGSRTLRIALLSTPGALFLLFGFLHWMRLSRHYNEFATQHQIVIEPVGGILLFVIAMLAVGGATYFAYTRTGSSALSA